MTVIKFQQKSIKEKFLGEKLVKRRKFFGLTQDDLAKMLSITKQAISDYELNKSTPKTEHIIKLATNLRVQSRFFYIPFSYKEEPIKMFFKEDNNCLFWNTKKREKNNDR